jgi:hypothetical protein
MPRWFDLLDRSSSARIQVKEITYQWTHNAGAAKILNFSVYDGMSTYQMSMNTLDFTWKAGIAVD